MSDTPRTAALEAEMEQAIRGLSAGTKYACALSLARKLERENAEWMNMLRDITETACLSRAHSMALHAARAALVGATASAPKDTTETK